MNERTFNGFMLSATLHALVVALLCVAYYIGEQASKTVPKVLELVAGEGDNYGALVAPALGTPGGIKLKLAEMPAATPTPPEPTPLSPAPEPVVERAPTPVTKAPAPTAEKKEEPIRDFSKDVKRIANKRAARLIEADRKKREAEERKAKEEELKKKRMTKEEFDRQNRAEKTAAKPGGTPKYSRLDAEGIASGVIGGSAANKVGGAGGKALSREEGEVMDAYFSLLKQRLHEALDKPPGLSDTLVATAEFRVAAGGGLSGARIIRSSGSEEFDDAVLAAIARVRSIGPRPDGKTETVSLNFRMREED